MEKYGSERSPGELASKVINHLIEETEITIEELAKITKIREESLTNLASGNADATLNFLEYICNSVGYSLDILIRRNEVS